MLYKVLAAAFLVANADALADAQSDADDKNRSRS